MTIQSINFNSKEEFVIDQLKEIAQNQPLSKFIKSILADYIQKFNTNPVLAEKQNESAKLEGLLQVLNDMQFMNHSINNMDDATLRVFENTLFALNVKVSKKFTYGTVNAR